METIRARLRPTRTVLGAGSIGRIEAFSHARVVVQPSPSAVMTVASRDSPARSTPRSSPSGARVEVVVDGSEAAVLWEKAARQAPVAAATAIEQRPIGELRADADVAGPAGGGDHRGVRVARATVSRSSPGNGRSSRPCRRS